MYGSGKPARHPPIMCSIPLTADLEHEEVGVDAAAAAAGMPPPPPELAGEALARYMSLHPLLRAQLVGLHGDALLSQVRELRDVVIGE